MLYDEKEVVQICKKYGINKDSIWDEISNYMKYLKGKLKLKSEMCIIGIKILFLRLKYLLCNVEMKVIEW